MSRLRLKDHTDGRACFRLDYCSRRISTQCLCLMWAWTYLIIVLCYFFESVDHSTCFLHCYLPLMLYDWESRLASCSRPREALYSVYFTCLHHTLQIRMLWIIFPCEYILISCYLLFLMIPCAASISCIWSQQLINLMVWCLLLKVLGMNLFLEKVVCLLPLLSHFPLLDPDIVGLLLPW